MKIAVPVWQDRVSPLFEAATRFVIVDVEAGEVKSRTQLPIPEAEPWKKAGRLRELGVAVLICGGIAGPVAAMVEASGVRLVPWVAGGTDEVLEAYLAGRLPSERFAMPGMRRMCRRRFGRGAGFRGGRGGQQI